QSNRKRFGESRRGKIRCKNNNGQIGTDPNRQNGQNARPKSDSAAQITSEHAHAYAKTRGHASSRQSLHHRLFRKNFLYGSLFPDRIDPRQRALQARSQTIPCGPGTYQTMQRRPAQRTLKTELRRWRWPYELTATITPQ